MEEEEWRIVAALTERIQPIATASTSRNENPFVIVSDGPRVLATELTRVSKLQKQSLQDQPNPPNPQPDHDPALDQQNQIQNSSSVFFSLSLLWSTPAKPIAENRQSQLNHLVETLRNLQSLRLSQNEAEDLHEGSIDMGLTPNLVSLQVESIPVESLIGWPSYSEMKIATLTLTNNSIKNSDASDFLSSPLGSIIITALNNPSEQFEGEENIVSRIGLMKNNLISISPDLIPLFSHLKILDLSQNKLSMFPTAVLNDVHCPYLESLNLSNNKITGFTIKLRQSTKQQSASLTSSQISDSSTSQQQNQSSFKSLHHLSLAFNEIEIIGDLAHCFPVLEFLSLESNNIQDVFEMKSCSVLISLKELQVAGNPICQNESHRLNIFTYFKSRAIESLKIDAKPPTSTEAREILVALTIAATSKIPSPRLSNSSLNLSNSNALSDISDLSFSKGLKKKKGAQRRAIVTVQEINPPATSVEEPNTTLQIMTRATPNVTDSSSNKLAVKPQKLQIESDLDLMMESMDSSDRSISPTSRVVSPEPSANIQQVTTAINSTGSPTSPPQFHQTLDDRSFTNYFDAQQDFSRHGSESSRHGSPDVPERFRNNGLGHIPKPITRRRINSSSSNEMGSSKEWNSGGSNSARVSPTLNPLNSGIVFLSPPRPAVSGALKTVAENVEEIVTTETTVDLGDIEDSTFMKRGNNFSSTSHKPGYPMMAAITSQFNIQRKEKKKKTANEKHFTELVESSDNSLSSSPPTNVISADNTPLANTPGQLRHNTNQLSANLPDSIKSGKNSISSDWHRKMAQVHEMGRREAQRVADEEAALENSTMADSPNSTSFSKRAEKDKSGFEAAFESHLPPQKPLMLAASSVSNSGSSAAKTGSNLDSIGPYRRVYNFEPSVKFQDEESVRSRSVQVSYVENRTVSPPRDQSGFLSSSPVRNLNLNPSSRLQLLRSDAVDMAPRLVLARPVASSAIHPRRFQMSEAGSERGESVYSSFQTRNQYSGNRSVMGGNASILSRESNGYSVFSGMTGASAMSRLQPSLASFRNNPSHPLNFPRSPNIPFLSINNSLQLHLKFKIFANDQEKILEWVTGSVVPQISPYIRGIAAQATSESFFSSLLPTSSAPVTTPSNSLDDQKTTTIIARMQNIERAAYILLTDKALYIFTPSFSMPHDPFSPDASISSASTAADPAAQMSQVINQVRYDDPGRTLRLARRIPLANLARVDVGPNRQFLGIHFLATGTTAADESSGSRSGGGGAGRRASGGISVESGLRGGGSASGRRVSTGVYSGSYSNAGGMHHLAAARGIQQNQQARLLAQQNPLPGIRSVVFLSRDRTATSRILDALVPVLYEGGGSSKFKAKGVDGKVRVVNQDVEWSLSALKNHVLLRKGDAQNILLNDVDVDGRIDWRDIIAARKNESRQQSNQSGGIGWFGGFFGGGTASQSETIQEAPKQIQHIIEEVDEDVATSTDTVLDKVNFEFLKLYLLVGWIVPHKLSTLPLSSEKSKKLPSLSVTVNSVSLIATKDYIYLTSERFDVWPPPIFPASTFPAPYVNSPLLEHAATATAMAARHHRSLPNMPDPSNRPPSPLPLLDPLKGLSASQIVQHSAPLRVGRVRDMIRCERWKTWRWKLGANVTQVEEAPVLEQKIAALVQNGAIGVVKVVEGEWPVGGGGSGGGDKSRKAGTTSGWEWWLRVVFKTPQSSSNIVAGKIPLPGEEENQESAAAIAGSLENSSAEYSATGDSSAGEYFWDLVFASLDAANEFLEFIKDVRGVKPIHETEDMSVFDHGISGSSGNGGTSGGGAVTADDEYQENGGNSFDFEETDFARDSRLFEKVAWDGVCLVIGDD
ncbi:hypothetical protein HK100_002806 [Physocladia obscura]|uniref:Uncharacterized protein n=1 Tax=Physocladia obscura TaxID=109957 RepID=A0AAD5XDZ4_9FUNG|nr:hypothetical protein HK100_002806 [Physocladia obscura]